jgi:hypothetical protein
MFLTRIDVDGLLHFAALTAANRVGVADAEWEPLKSTVGAVKQRNEKLGCALEIFVSAYQSWFAFGEWIDGEGKSGNLSPLENKRLVELIEQRDLGRQEFMAALKNAG